ncbi:MAG: hypothetical protein IPM35_17735 [Myxococcales bacterium]|nr:hypothetical protein [Myxococcales bacterium]
MSCTTTSSGGEGSIRKRYQASSDASNPQPVSPTAWTWETKCLIQLALVGLAAAFARRIPPQEAEALVAVEALPHAGHQARVVVLGRVARRTVRAALIPAMPAQARRDHADVQIRHRLAAAVGAQELVHQARHGFSQDRLLVRHGDRVVDHQEQIDLARGLERHAPPAAQATAAASAARAAGAATATGCSSSVARAVAAAARAR